MDRLAIVEEHVRLENAHDLDGIMGTFGTDARYDDEPWNEHHLGCEQVRTYYRTLLRVAPDLKTDVKERHLSGDAVILEVIVSGTQCGTWRGLPPTAGSSSSRFAESSPLAPTARSPVNAFTTTARLCSDSSASSTSQRRYLEGS